MAQLFVVHPTNPQLRLLRQAAQMIEHGGVAAVPTDSCYALVCRLDDKAAADRVTCRTGGRGSRRPCAGSSMPAASP